MRTRKTIFALFSASVVLSGCGGGEVDELKSWIDTEKKMARPAVQKINEPKVFVPVDYSSRSSVDPFDQSKLLTVLARMKAESSNGIKPDLDRRKEVLESFPLDSLKMVGLIEKKNDRQALIQMDSSVYQVRVGNYMGQNFGMITKITENEIELRELIQDPAGDWVERISRMELQENTK